ncbi:MAG: hypothetical protein Q4P28_03555 [Tissierellia bacterium]|nr:hypothetical protein [Tissierellia bacterium]
MFFKKKKKKEKESYKYQLIEPSGVKNDPTIVEVLESFGHFQYEPNHFTVLTVGEPEKFHSIQVSQSGDDQYQVELIPAEDENLYYLENITGDERNKLFKEFYETKRIQGWENWSKSFR